MDAILNGLATAGFNGVRLPMWPESASVRGPDPDNETRDIGRDFCDSLNKIWVTRILTAPDDALYRGFTIIKLQRLLYSALR